MYIYGLRHSLIKSKLSVHAVTRSTLRAQTSLAEADHYFHITPIKILSLDGERLTPKVLDHYLHHHKTNQHYQKHTLLYQGDNDNLNGHFHVLLNDWFAYIKPQSPFSTVCYHCQFSTAIPFSQGGTLGSL